MLFSLRPARVSHRSHLIQSFLYSCRRRFANRTAFTRHRIKCNYIYTYTYSCFVRPAIWPRFSPISSRRNILVYAFTYSGNIQLPEYWATEKKVVCDFKGRFSNELHHRFTPWYYLQQLSQVVGLWLNGVVSADSNNND